MKTKHNLFQTKILQWKCLKSKLWNIKECWIWSKNSNIKNNFNKNKNNNNLGKLRRFIIMILVIKINNNKFIKLKKKFKISNKTNKVSKKYKM